MDPQPREKKKKEMEEMDKLIGSDVVRKQGKVKISSGDYIFVCMPTAKLSFGMLLM